MDLKTLTTQNVISPEITKHVAFKTKTQVIKHINDKQNLTPLGYPFQTHHAFRYIRETFPSQDDFKQFVALLYKGIHYGVKNLKTPTEYFVEKKKVKLLQPEGRQKKKILFMDLDQTLIHSQFMGMSKFKDAQVKLQVKGVFYRFNIRPQCLQFLDKMSDHFNIYVFTAGTEQYAQIIINYLNRQKETIIGFLHKKHCMQTNQGCHVKDLGIVENRGLKDIVIVGNLALSFALNIQNRIPILQSTDQKNDVELRGIQEMLTQIAESEDVRDYLRQKLALKKILDVSQSEYKKIESLVSPDCWHGMSQTNLIQLKRFQNKMISLLILYFANF